MGMCVGDGVAHTLMAILLASVVLRLLLPVQTSHPKLVPQIKNCEALCNQKNSTAEYWQKTCL